jgi:hypothetical protein
VLGCGSKNDFAINDFSGKEHREARIQRREFLPLFAFTFTLPCNAEVAQRSAGFTRDFAANNFAKTLFSHRCRS